MAEPIIVVESRRDWTSEATPVAMVLADDYLSDPKYGDDEFRVINLCRSLRYQSLGYYVSLLAEARGHRVLPSVTTLADLSRKMLYGAEIPALAHDLVRLDATTQAALPNTFRVFMGRARIEALAPVARKLFEQLAVPLMEVGLSRRDAALRVTEVRALGLKSLSAEDATFMAEAVAGYVARGWVSPKRRRQARFDLAILVDPDETQPPSNAAALNAFVEAGQALGLAVERITRRDFGRLAEFDALFIRETTRLNHHTYAFARRAEQLGLVVIDDPVSILRCSNKVYLAELLARHRVAAPRAHIFGEDEVDQLPELLGFPMVLKAPEGAFSKGVFKADDRHALDEIAARLFDDSELALAQEFMPTEFDWRVGVLDGRPLYVCQYLMAGGHWQIVDYSSQDGIAEGDSRTLDVVDAPTDVVEIAVRAAGLIGNGLYGVDIKQTADGLRVIEINDNPSIDAGIEDAVAGQTLYRTIMSAFLARLEARTRPEAG
ncbi:RimK family protein [Salinisphaera sp. Q1T1-3]|uniref:RimK family protein n=1 Tax=Salinisphaera sp. Q1T1-3 TaxID=2321229 RepID=UPI000E75FCB5|nr:RimK family protein [Salinisphaera sp. Q1T1-3]RJS91386.1 RimK family alpha-L-glutamate ligase [Salinisphaera sp. Q1T1-3]